MGNILSAARSLLSWKSERHIAVVPVSPVLFVVAPLIVCMMWWDMQHRFTVQTERILANQIEIRKAEEEIRRATAITSSVENAMKLNEDRFKKNLSNYESLSQRNFALLKVLEQHSKHLQVALAAVNQSVVGVAQTNAHDIEVLRKDTKMEHEEIDMSAKGQGKIAQQLLDNDLALREQVEDLAKKLAAMEVGYGEIIKILKERPAGRKK